MRSSPLNAKRGAVFPKCPWNNVLTSPLVHAPAQPFGDVYSARQSDKRFPPKFFLFSILDKILPMPWA